MTYSGSVKGKVQIKGMLHIHRADGSVEDRPFVGYVDPDKLAPNLFSNKHDDSEIVSAQPRKE